jgi:hypothetical protein
MYTEVAELVGDQLLETVNFVNGRTIAIVTCVNDTVSKLLPNLPAVPAADSLPSPSEVLSANFAVAERLFQAQQKFTLDLVGAATPKRT